MIIHYETSIVDITGFRNFDISNSCILINFESASQICIKMPSREQALEHIKTIAFHLRENCDYCYLEDADG